MHVHTIADLQAVPPKRMWQLMRTLRHEPPGRAGKGARRDTFNAALEQAEQLFAAAEATGSASRPILLFYGLSQLGRAIAAVSTRLDNKDYRLFRHGIDDGSLESAAIHGLASLRVASHDSGAYPTVAHALNADPNRKGRSLGELWALIPDAARFPLPGADGPDRLTMRTESRSIVRPPDSGRFWIGGLPLHLLTGPDERPVSEPGEELASLMHQSQEDPDRIAFQRQALVGWLARYPTLAGWDFKNNVEPDKSVEYQVESARLAAPIRLPRQLDESEQDVLARRAILYHSTASVYPTLDGDGLAAHPFMLWWAVLYVLSRLARYEPRAWVQLIDIARSADAAAIEYLLSEALLALPELAYSCLESASQQ